MENRKEIEKLVRYIATFLLVCAIFILGFYIGRANPDYSSNASPQYVLTGDIKSQYQEVSVNILWETWQRLEQEYLAAKDLDPQTMVYGAVKGMIASLDDPYTAFLTPEEVVEYFKSNAGEYEGIGATLMQDGAYVKVESAVDDTPAQRAGLKAGDVILSVNDEDVYNKSVYEVVSKIRGEAGSTVKLNIFRESDQQELELSITRAKIDIDNIALQDLGNGFYKIKIYKFTENSVEDFNRIWDSIVEGLVSKNPKGIIIDLRNNPGGYVSAVEHVLGEFLNKDQIALIEESKNGVRVEHKIDRVGRLLNVPLIVMVNGGSASASEIFAGAIQDYARGKIIGQKTVGKGVEQKLLNLSDGSMLQVVFQRWLTPLGKNISKDDPIQPDIVLEETDLTDAKALELLNN
jgi:carboxyl-terminal processing protease